MSLEKIIGKLGRLNYARVERKLVAGLREYAEGAGRLCGVVGLSGGLDSSVTACIAAKAFGATDVIGLLLPSKATREIDQLHARDVAKMLGIRLMEASVQPAVEALKGQLSNSSLRPLTKIDEGNLAARARMACLYNVAARSGGLVIGTGDRSELLLGYFTKYGDGGGCASARDGFQDTGEGAGGAPSPSARDCRKAPIAKPVAGADCGGGARSSV